MIMLNSNIYDSLLQRQRSSSNRKYFLHLYLVVSFSILPQQRIVTDLNKNINLLIGN